MLYSILKLIHVLLAITAVGSNVTYAVWLGRADRDPAHLGFALKGIKFIDDRVANPCYGLLLPTGLLMVWVGGIDLRHGIWVALGIFLWLVLVVIAVSQYTPALKRQIAALDAEGPESTAYRAASARATQVGIVLAVIALLIVADMVLKPHV